MKFRCSEVDKSDIFVSFLGSYSSDRYACTGITVH